MHRDRLTRPGAGAGSATQPSLACRPAKLPQLPACAAQTAPEGSAPAASAPGRPLPTGEVHHPGPGKRGARRRPSPRPRRRPPPPSQDPEPTGATTHRVPPGRESPRRWRAAAARAPDLWTALRLRDLLPLPAGRGSVTTAPPSEEPQAPLSRLRCPAGSLALLVKLSQAPPRKSCRPALSGPRGSRPRPGWSGRGRAGWLAASRAESTRGGEKPRARLAARERGAVVSRGLGRGGRGGAAARPAGSGRRARAAPPTSLFARLRGEVFPGVLRSRAPARCVRQSLLLAE